MAGEGDREELRRLLRERNEHPERLAELDAAIRARFTCQLAVFVLDMSGFSRLTHHYGIIHFLAMIERMRSLVLPVLSDPCYSGRVVKLEADNAYAVFPDVPDAVAAALETHRALDAANRVLPEDWDVHVSIGIGHGEVLAVGQDDLYGHEMNLACKLGEDVGHAGDILLTEAAFARLPPGRHAVESLATTVSRLPITYHRLVDGRSWP
jgi:class 3 adenylate cyclase